MDHSTLLAAIRKNTDHPMKLKELSRALGIAEGEYSRFRKLVKELIDRGDLVRLKRGRIGLAAELNVLVGEFQMTKSGLGFLLREPPDPDVRIPPFATGTALDKDTVMVRLTRSGEQPTGEVIRVVERSERNIVGVLRRRRHYVYVEPDNPRIHRDIYIPDAELHGARDGDKVVAQLAEWDDPHLQPIGTICERLGRPHDPGVDMLSVIKSFDLPESFPDVVLNEAELLAAKANRMGRRGRIDCRSDIVYTIDPADAKDHDDAISVTRSENGGFRLAVHIADVATFVKPGSALDKEAYRRGNSVYLPGTVIPMLPEALSNDVCSLRPDRDRLAHTVWIDFDARGIARSWETGDTIIRSAAKLSYEEAQAFLESGQRPDTVSAEVAENLRAAQELARLLTQQRFNDGSLDFDLPESQIILDDDGTVIDLRRKPRLEAHRLIEECMLAANRAVALEAKKHRRLMLYRVHDKPDHEKLEAFAYMVKRLGHHFPVSKSIHPRQFGDFLQSIKDQPESDFINELMLRSMQKAVYQRDNIGHFGLAFPHYTHFTSPIRRYPDLIVHRLLRQMRANRYPKNYTEETSAMLDQVGRWCSETERVAETAERQAIKIKQVQYMRDKVGEVFDGVISGVQPYGFFVRLDPWGVEGMVRISAIDDDYYVHEEENYRLVGTRRRRVFRLGDTVRVQVMRVDIDHHEIDFALDDLARAESTPSQPAVPAARRGPKRNGGRSTRRRKK